MAYLEELLPEFRKGYILGEIKGNKFHFVTPDGRVLSFAKDKPVWRKPTPDKDGYLCIGIKISGKNTTRKIHRLVAEAFIPNPENKPEVNHKNGVKSDNRIDNLEWATAKENSRHKREVLKYRPSEETLKKIKENRKTKGVRKKQYDFAIKERVICWFYNNSHQQKTIGFLNSFDEDYFWADNGKTYKFCRPVRRDEVNFYEDKKDEQD